MKNRPVESEKVVTISESELTEIMAEATHKIVSSDSCPPAMILIFAIYSAKVLAKIFKNKGEN